VKILLLEDDYILSSSLEKFLKFEGYEVSLATNGNEVLNFTYENRYDLYLFDINVPYINGIDLLRELRDSGDKTPTFFITALIDTNSLSRAFDAGCDDYIKKPFDIDELLIRMKSILKRSYGSLTYKDIVYNYETREIKKLDKVINLATVEMAIFELFIKNKEKIIVKEDLYWVMETPSSGGLRVNISRLKKILGLNIKNIRGVGYKLEEL